MCEQTGIRMTEQAPRPHDGPAHHHPTTPLLRLSHTPILPSSHTPILPSSHTLTPLHLPLFLLLFLAGSLSHAHCFKYARCLRAAEPIKIDGKLDEWDGSEAISIDHTMVSYGAKPKDDRDASYKLHTLWDDKGLHFAATVRDESIVAQHAGDKIYENDCLEIALDLKHDSWEGSYGDDDYQFVFSVPLNRVTGPMKHIFRNPTAVDPEAPDVELAYERFQGGYLFEISIPWRTLGLDEPPASGTVMGFQNDLRDRDRDGSAAGLCWLPFFDPTASPLQFGHLILVEDKGQDIAPLVAQFAREATRSRGLRSGEAEEDDNEVLVTVGEPTEHHLALGFGWNVQFYDGHLPSWSETDWEAFLALLKWSRPAWVRYGLNLGQWEPVNDDDDPDHFEWGNFRFDSPLMKHHVRMLDFFEANGIDVMVCNWYVGDPASGANWLAEQKGLVTVPSGHHYYLDAPRSDDEFVESIAALVHFLKEEKQYSCVKFVSLWNEPDGSWTYNSPKAKYPNTFWPLYAKLDAKLKEMGLRNRVGLAGPDTATGTYRHTLNIEKYLETYEAPLDLICDHDYSAFFDHHRPRGSTTTARAVKQYSSFLGRLRKVCKKLGREVPPFAITEYGNHGNASGPVEGDFEVFKGTLAVHEFALRCLPAGVDGFLRWEFKPYGKSWQNFGALTKLETGYRFAPYPPVFYPHALLTRYSRKGAKILSVDVKGGKDEHGSPRVNAAAILMEPANVAPALRDGEPAAAHEDNKELPGAHLTLWLTNSGQKPKQVALNLGPYKAHPLPLTGLLYDATCGHRYLALETKETDRGLSCTLPPRSVAVLTTLEKPDSPELKLPLELSPKLKEPTYHAFDVGGFRRVVTLFSFEEPVEWDVWRSSPGKSGFSETKGEAVHGDQSCLLSYDFVSTKTLGREEHLVATTPVNLDAMPLEVSLHIRGDGAGHVITFLFVDEQGETFECPKRVTVSWKGWKKVSVSLAGMPRDYTCWGSASDGVLDFPLRGFGLILREAEKKYVGNGTILLDDVRILAKPILGEP